MAGKNSRKARYERRRRAERQDHHVPQPTSKPMPPELEAALHGRLREAGLDPDQPVTLEQLDSAMAGAVRDYNDHLASVPSAQAADLSTAWRAYAQACFARDGRPDTAAQSAATALLSEHAAAAIAGALALVARLSLQDVPLQDPAGEERAAAALGGYAAELLAGRKDPGYAAEESFLTAIYRTARAGADWRPLLAGGGEILLNRLLVLIGSYIRGRITEGRAPQEIVDEVVAVATESVTRHL